MAGKCFLSCVVKKWAFCSAFNESLQNNWTCSSFWGFCRVRINPVVSWLNTRACEKLHPRFRINWKASGKNLEIYGLNYWQKLGSTQEFFCFNTIAVFSWYLCKSFWAWKTESLSLKPGTNWFLTSEISNWWSSTIIRNHQVQLAACWWHDTLEFIQNSQLSK